MFIKHMLYDTNVSCIIIYMCKVMVICAYISHLHVLLPYPRERAPTTECPPTPLFWLNFLLWSKVYAVHIVHNLLHYNNAAAASYLVWNYVNMPVGCG